MSENMPNRNIVFLLEKYTADFFTNFFMKHIITAFPHKPGDLQKLNWSKKEFTVDSPPISTAEIHSNTTKALG